MEGFKAPLPEDRSSPTKDKDGDEYGRSWSWGQADADMGYDAAREGARLRGEVPRADRPPRVVHHGKVTWSSSLWPRPQR